MKGVRPQIKKTMVSWKNEFPPSLPSGGFLVSRDGNFWEEVELAEVKELANREIVVWNSTEAKFYGKEVVV